MSDDRIITARERRRLIPYSDMHIWRLERRGCSRSASGRPNRVGWSLVEVTAWMEDKKSGRFAPQVIRRGLLQRFNLRCAERYRGFPYVRD